MPIATTVWLEAKEGCDDALAEVLKKMTPLTRDEPGCIAYQAHRDPENPRKFFLYESYRTESDVEFHRNTEHFSKYVVGESAELVESRKAAQFELL